MAGIITPHFGFHPAAVDHSPSPLGFAFGLSSAASVPGWQPPGMQTPPFVPSASTFSGSQKAAQKRRHDDSDHDEAMDRSPTPERRPVRPMKQMRVRPAESRSQEGAADHGKASKENRSARSDSGDDVDVGMLLASLPPQSLLPILTSLLSTNPSLKPTVLSLIPRPTLDTALNALNQAAKKLVEEYPYSASSQSFTRQSPSISFGFGTSSSTSSFGRSTSPGVNHAGMRDDYVLSRLRPAISDFVSTVFSYMPYFSFMSDASDLQPAATGKEKIYPHPSETFAYLSAVTNHLINQPPLCQSSLAPLLLPRLLQEWMAWVNRVNEVLKQGGMIGSGIAESWIEALDRYAEVKIEGVNDNMKYGLSDVRNRWISVAGWLVGRNVPFV
ncbi:uncharacterized protein FOMMEDRAFT_81765 [Fomitiporia mediterranea MF3/22]|uniref:uncharacterized protein n=1 Tax=Fomitiporia mediterranea (strain MF3/22) TaxID=694068 RepID=UPI0004408E34|nr:uncharacterized protein FOMMEDRAFT_81765 [Fomitiporia mediterranea MF3/22]EJD03996.1 hypothetical protein FOMMEDRAFT_81765 [Fomitiporia mediterranea MF3/22]